MSVEWFMARVGALRVLPLVTLDPSMSGRVTAEALGSAGLTVMEISLSSARAPEVIADVARALPDVLLGAGTVTRAEQVDEALAAGAHFIASPIVDRDVLRRAEHRGVPAIPGVQDHADVISAAREGARVARVVVGPGTGGPAMLRRYARLFPSMQFIPAGWIEPAEMPEYLGEPGVLAVASTWFAPHGATPAEIGRRAARAAFVVA